MIIAGIIMIIFVSLSILPFWWIPESHVSSLVFLAIFTIIGGLLIFVGIAEKKLKKNINEYGFKCYGIVKQLMQNGEYSGDKEGGSTIVQIFNPNTNQIEDKKI